MGPSAPYFESPRMWVWPQLPFGGHPLGDRPPDGPLKPFLAGRTAGGPPKAFPGPGSLSLQRRHLESSKVLAGLAFCKMPTQCPRSVFQGFSGVARGCQQQVCDPNPPRPFARYRFVPSTRARDLFIELTQTRAPKVPRGYSWQGFCPGPRSGKSLRP